MKKLALFVGCILIFGMVSIGFGGCSVIQQDGGSDSTDINGKDLVIVSFVDLYLDEEGKNGNINLFYEAKKEYEKKYGAKITFKLYNNDVFQNKLIQMIGSNSSPDLIYCGSLHMPRFAAMEILQPVDDYIDTSTLNFQKAAESLMWAGKHYAARVEQVQPYVIWYNRKIFQKNGIEEPYTLWKKGEWTWEKFREVGIKLTQDTTNSGQITQWGFGTSGIYTPMWANAGKWFTIDDNKQVKITWKEPAFYNGLKFMQDAVNVDKWWCPDSVLGYSQFAAGNFAMVGEPFEFTHKYASNMDTIIIGCAPWPEGPNFQENGGNYYCACNLLGIANGAKNPYGAAEFCNIMTRMEKEMDVIPLGNAEAEKYLSEQDKEVLYYVRDHALIDSLGWGEWTGERWFYPIVVNNQDISKTLDSLESVLRAEIDRTLSYKMPEVKNFNPPAPLTFEDNSLGYLTTDGCNGGSVDITGDAGKVIEGKKSLYIKMDSTNKIVLRTDINKLKIPAYRSYRITFDWKFIRVSDECKEYGMDVFATIRPLKSIDSDVYQFGFISFAGVDGDSGSALGEINLNTSEENLCLVFSNGLNGTGEIVIDNLQITEIVS